MMRHRCSCRALHEIELLQSFDQMRMLSHVEYKVRMPSQSVGKIKVQLQSVDEIKMLQQNAIKR